jgi:hypothetical protein
LLPDVEVDVAAVSAPGDEERRAEAGVMEASTSSTGAGKAVSIDTVAVEPSEPRGDVDAADGGVIAGNANSGKLGPAMQGVDDVGATATGMSGDAGAGNGDSTWVEFGCESMWATFDIEFVKADVDLVLVVDGSNTMTDEVAALQANIQKFATFLENHVNYHLVVLADQDPASGTKLPSDAMHYLHVPARVDRYNALQVLLDMWPQYAEFLRQDSAKHFIVMSDSDSALPASVFEASIEPLLKNGWFSFHAITSENVMGRACMDTCGVASVCGALEPGLEYDSLRRYTGGTFISICTTDWTIAFVTLARRIVGERSLFYEECEFQLGNGVVTPGYSISYLLRVELAWNTQPETFADAPSKKYVQRVDNPESCGSDIAWYYDNPALPTAIRMCQTTCDLLQSGADVNVDGDCIVTGPKPPELSDFPASGAP